MEQQYEESSAVLKVTLVLIAISTFIVLILGTAIKAINEENKDIKYFLGESKTVQPNFEKSLLIYTENTYKDIEYVHSLRPINESDYIKFISTIEDIGQKNSLNISLNTLDESSSNQDSSGSHFIDYKIRFYSTKDQLLSFLNDIDALNYFTKILNLEYTTYQLPDNNKSVDSPNVNLTLRLYVK